MDGTLFLAGGNKDHEGPFPNGIKDTHTFDSATNSWTRRAGDMETERWYPSVTPLSNGEMMITEGIEPPKRTFPSFARSMAKFANSLASKQSHGPLPMDRRGAERRCPCHRPGRLMQSFNTSGNGSGRDGASETASTAATAAKRSTTSERSSSPAGATTDPAEGRHDSASAVVVDMNEPDAVSRTLTSMEYPRRQHNLTVLADGTVLATGGLLVGRTARGFPMAFTTRNSGTRHGGVVDARGGGQDSPVPLDGTAIARRKGALRGRRGLRRVRRRGYIEKSAQVFLPLTSSRTTAPAS